MGGALPPRRIWADGPAVAPLADATFCEKAGAQCRVGAGRRRRASAGVFASRCTFSFTTWLPASIYPGLFTPTRPMSFAASARPFILLTIGLVVGGLGTTLFRESLPGSAGSPEERAQKLEAELKQARNRVAEFEAEAGASGHDRKRTMADGMRGIAGKIRAGQAVNPDDIFRASQPLMRDLAPLFDRMRLQQERRMIDSKAGELARKYDLSPQDQVALRQWFEEKSAAEAQRWTEMIGRDGTRLEDIVRASREVRPDEGLEKFMEGVLSPEKLAGFKAERMTERAGRVQREADMMVTRLDSIVQLDETQKDQVFATMARSSKDYDPAMVLEGVSAGTAAAPGTNRQEAILSVLSADQRSAYEIERQRRYEEAAKDMRAIGLTLPANWDMLDHDGW